MNPIAGALGAAFFVGVMQIGERYALSGLEKTSPLQTREALMNGVHWSFGAGVLVAVAVGYFVLKFRNHPGKMSH